MLNLWDEAARDASGDKTANFDQIFTNFSEKRC